MQDQDQSQGSQETKPNAPRFSDNFKHRPPVHTIHPPEWPPRPDVFDEVKLAPFLSEADAKIAYQVWSLPDQTLGKAWRRHQDRPYLRPPHDLDLHVLAHNVYEHLMSDPLIPVSRKDAAANFAAEGLQKVWDTSALLGPMKHRIIKDSVLHDVSSWALETVKLELEKRGLSAVGTRERLEKRLIDNELERHCGIMPRSNLAHWDINRAEKYTLQPVNNKQMSALDMYTFAIHLSPYNPTYWVSRAYCHYQQAFFDLAIGDAYRAQLLCDVLEKAKERNKQPGLYPRIWHAMEQHLLAESRVDGELKPEVTRMRRENGINYFVPTLQKAVQNIISLCLAALNSWDDYSPQKALFTRRLAMPDRDARVPEFRRNVTKVVAKAHYEHTRKQKLFWHEKFQGYISAEHSYPYEEDVSRANRAFLNKLNQNLFQCGQDGSSVFSGACEARLAPNRQGLGVFATSNIKKGELIYYEEPTIRGHLPSRRMKKDRSAVDEDEPRCENCQKAITASAMRQSTKGAGAAGIDNVCECFGLGTHRPGTQGLLFCRSNQGDEKSCLQIARELYHFTSCGKDWTWLYDAMRPNTQEFEGREHLSHTNESHGTMLSLLLRNVFEITLHHRKNDPNLCPHEIDELLVLDGGGQSWRDSWFPFTMPANVIVPFDILRCLGVDIFQDLTFDTWAIQLILRKLLTNVVPWDQQRRGRVPDMKPHDRNKELEHPDLQKKRFKNKQPFTDWDPSFMNLYLFPGLSMFNHSCRGAHNADWGCDTQVPNRVIVWAATNIKKGDEIRVRYRYGKFQSQNRAARFFGGPCQCPQCNAKPGGKYTAQTNGYDGDTDSDQTILTDGSQPDEQEEQPPQEELQDGKLDEPQSEEVQDQPTQESRKRKREHAEVENGRVVIHQNLYDEDTMAKFERQRQESPIDFDPDSTSRQHKPITKRQKGEDESVWAAREIIAIRERQQAAHEAREKRKIEKEADQQVKGWKGKK